MRGQWTGKYEGSTGGEIILNIDEFEENYVDVAHLFPADPNLPRVAASFTTPNKSSPFNVRTDDIYAFEPSGVSPVRWTVAKSHFPPDMPFSSYADVEGKWDEQSLTLDWKSDLDAIGHSVLPRSKASDPSEMKARQMSWREFKTYLETLKTRALIFRGQSKQWRLRTRFHRTGRSNLYRYRNEDIPQLYRHLSARTKHLFDLNDAHQFGSFCSMIQHHGYPTPMVDWSKSPYVAAFFAYRTITREDVAKAANARVRIHLFEYERWKKTFPQFPNFLFPGPHVSVIEFVSTENERLIPQQDVSTVTTIDDIETYIQGKESETDFVYLSACDLPVAERNKVMDELSYMGITAGSLFPGLDDACEELRERNFGI